MGVACYTRVSTAEQNLERQITATSEYAEDRLDLDLGDLEVYRDRSTGTNTKRDGYRNMMESAEGDEIDAVVVKSVSRIARSIRDLERTVDRLESADTALHIIDEGITIDPNADDPFTKATLRLLGVFAQLEAEMGQVRTKEGIAVRQEDPEYHHGPAPIGFEKDDGYLVEGEEYDRVCAVLDMVAKDEISKRKAARQLDTSRSTINRALERWELYGL